MRLCLDIPGEGWFGLGGWGRLGSFAIGGGGIGVPVGDGIASRNSVVSVGVSVPVLGLLVSVDMSLMVARFLSGRDRK